ncbi:MAG: hypothetical protein IKH51_08165, partial [Clostridia bacterium]|nr:hypothetical protein [Clostridia bacterium]
AGSTPATGMMKRTPSGVFFVTPEVHGRGVEAALKKQSGGLFLAVTEVDEPCATKGVPRRELESVGGSRRGRMKQGEESAAVDRNQAQSRQRRADFFGHRKRFCKAHILKSTLMPCKNQERFPSSPPYRVFITDLSCEYSIFFFSTFSPPAVVSKCAI